MAGEKCRAFWKKIRKYLILIALALGVSCAIEALFQLNVWKASRAGDREIRYAVSDASCVGMRMQGDRLVSDGTAGEIHIYPGGSYVDKLVYSYNGFPANRTMDVQMDIVADNAYGERAASLIVDSNPYVLRQSVVHIGKRVTEICMHIPAGMSGVEIYGIRTQNIPYFHWMRWLFFFSLIALALLLWVGRDYFARNVEKLFLVVGLTAGTVLVAIMPLNKIGFDEEVHFRKAYNIKLSAEVSSTPAIEQLKGVTLANWPYNIAQTPEERRAIAAYYEKECDYRAQNPDRIFVPTEKRELSGYAYIFMALGVKLGKLLHLPFLAVFLLGRLFNMWSYIFLVYFAVKRLPIGKYIMMAIALMPTPMFQAATYSYDAVITGCIYLGLACLIAELMEKDRILTVREGFLMLASLGFGILPKITYIPLMGLPFLIRKDKFRNRAQRVIFRIATAVCIVGLLYSVVDAARLSPGILNDVRGGNVDSAAQMALVLQYPLGFLKVLGTSIKNTFWSYSFGEGAFGTLGHLGLSVCAPLIGLFLIGVIATDNIDRSEADLERKHKAVFLAAAALAALLVWGALYLTFNEVGSTFIEGVQGRYFIPLLFPFYLLLRRKKLKNTLPPAYYHAMVFGVLLFIHYRTFYESILKPLCF